MHRYKYVYRAVQAVFILVTVALLLFLLLPIWLYDEKPPSEITYGAVGSDDLLPGTGALSQGTGALSPGAGWIMDFYKMSRDDQNADLLFFRDAKAVNLENENRLQGKAAVFEMLFSQETLNKDAQSRLEYLTGASYSGFWGKTYEELGDRKVVPERLIALYESTAQTSWNYRGEGVVLTDGSRVVVLQQGEEYKGRMEFRTGDDAMPYYGYFEITSGLEFIPGPETASGAGPGLASGEGPAAGEFSLKLTASGSKIFEQYDLPASFPAIYKMANNLYDGYYFAGDFSELKVSEPFAYETMPWLLSHKGIYDKYKNDQVYWKAYYPLVSRLIDGMEQRRKSGLPIIALKDADKSAFFADSEKIYRSDAKPEPFFIKGVNLGAALPGRAFTEFPQEKETYSGWLSQMASLNVNTVRVYTLLPPAFYQALYEYNKAHGSEPLYLLQEIWPEEKPEGNNYLGKAYNEIYRKEIEYTVRAVHGDVVIPERDYRSCGMYAYDVSPYLIGYLVGRELEPDEVLSTDRLNTGYRYQGEYIYSEPEATPTEAWLAQSCDYALSLEDQRYRNKPLASIVSWPTLDLLTHDSEWNPSGDKALQYNDKAEVNINRIGINRANVNGFFGAYHIYPNYPDFMNNDVAYNSYQDGQGRFRYGGYLEAFMEQHKKYPALVAEFGLSTSLAVAHYSPDGYNHGGLSEAEQARGIIRMADAIVKEGYAGAVIFEWMDEWTKKTWTTEYYMIPYNRHMLWQNMLDPEQNYGVLAHQANAPVMKTVYDGTGTVSDGTKAGAPIRQPDFLEQAAVGQDASYLNIELTFKDGTALSGLDGTAISGPDANASIKPLSLELSTYAAPGETKTVWEFDILIAPEPKVLVNPGYDWLKGRYASVGAPLSSYEELIQQTNPENLTKDGVFTPAKYQNLSHLPGLITVEDRKVMIRLPYALIGFSDPSSRKVLYDPDSFIPNGVDQIGVMETPEIRLRVTDGAAVGPEIVYKTIAWDEPDYIERQKDGFRMLSDYFKSLDPQQAE